MTMEEINMLVDVSQKIVGAIVGHHIAEVTTSFITNQIGEQTGIKKYTVGLTSIVIAGVVCSAVDDWLDNQIRGVVDGICSLVDTVKELNSGSEE